MTEDRNGERFVKIRKAFTVANGLSFFRILLLPFILIFLAERDSSNSYIALILMFLAGVSDIFDGYLARRLNQISNFGMIIDPLADKISIVSVAIFLVFLRGFPIWVLILILCKDICIVTGSLLLIRKRDVLLPSNFLGKYTTFTLALSIVAFTLRLEPWKWYLIYIGVILILSSGVSYFLLFLKFWHREPSGHR